MLDNKGPPNKHHAGDTSTGMADLQTIIAGNINPVFKGILMPFCLQC